MRLSPREIEGLLTSQVGYLAQRRLARGVRLNHPESVALIASQLQEYARDGRHTVAELMSLGREFLGRRQVMPHVARMIPEVQIEATFPDGTKLVTVHQPICRSDGDLQLALYGSFLPVPDLAIFGSQENDSTDDGVVPGEVIPMSGHLEINQGRKRIELTVSSHCDRPIQIGSHYHFIETNPMLIFDRRLAYGMRLNIPAGTSIRFEPGETKKIPLVEIGGRKTIRGGNSLCDGPCKEDQIEKIMERVVSLQFGHRTQNTIENGKPSSISRFQYALTYGPTIGDKIRLGDTDLIIEVEKDFTIYGDECKFGGGKVLREGMGQAALVNSDQALDTVITNALIIDSVAGVFKADIGIKNGRILAIGKAGNPDIMDGVTPGMIVGVGTEAIAGEGKIITAGAIDTHVHFICPQLVREAIASGITTMYGGGTGPAAGTCATTCTPGPNHIKFMLEATDSFPMNFGFTGKGNTSNESDEVGAELEEQIRAGAVGLKLHEDWGTTPASIDHALRCGDKFDVQVMIHTDTLNESSCVEHTIKAFKGRTIHTYHTEGAGGGHAPDILRVVSSPSVIPSSTNPTRPYTVNTLDEHLDMLMVCHHLDKNLREDIAFAESRIRAETIAAEDILHDVGAISIISSDSQAMGRIGEVITRTWQTADKMRKLRGRLPEEQGDNDNLRVRRYLAKYTINPAVTCGMSKMVGSVRENQLADLVIWEPQFFGAKPHMVLKGGQIAYAQMGMPNASIPTPEPVIQRKMFAAYGKAVKHTSIAFVSKVSLEQNVVQSYGLSKMLAPVQNCRNITKKDMVLNDLTPDISVNPQTYEVAIQADPSSELTATKTLLTCQAAEKLTLAQRYFLF